MLQQTAILAQSQGHKVEVPDLAQVKADFDAYLLEDPKDIDQTELIKMRALGVSRGR